LPNGRLSAAGTFLSPICVSLVMMRGLLQAAQLL
jgi:hypothetical protein